MTRLWRKWWPALVALALTCVALWPLPRELFTVSRVADTTFDDYVFYWNFWWIQRALFELHANPYFCPEIFHPHGANVAVSPLALPYAFLAMPFQAFLGSPHGGLVALKWIGFATFPIAVLGGLRLGVSLGFSRVASFLGGCFYAFVPFRLMHMARIHYLGGALTPWFALWFLATLRHGRPRDLWKAGAVFAIGGACDGSLLPDWALLGIALAVAEACRQGWLQWRIWPRAAGAAAAGVLLLSPYLGPFLLESARNPGVDVSTGLYYHGAPDRTQIVLSPDVNNLAYYLSPSLHEQWLGTGEGYAATWRDDLGRGAEAIRNIHLGFRPPGDSPEWELIGGVAALAATVAGFLWGFRDRRTWPFLALGIVGAGLAVGPYRTIGGETVEMPYYYLSRLIPPLRAGRYPAAHIRLLHLAIAVVGMAGLTRWGRWSGSIGGLALALTAIGWAARPYHYESFEPERIYQIIAADPVPGAVLDLPPRHEIVRRRMALGHITHRRPLLNGPLTRVPKQVWVEFDEGIVRRLLRPPRPEPRPSPARLAEFESNLEWLDSREVRWIVVRKALAQVDPEAWRLLHAYLAQHPRLEVELIDGHFLIRVVPPA